MFGSSRIQQLAQGSAQTRIRAGECCLTSIRGYSSSLNPNLVQSYIQVFDVATAAEITVGTTSPNWVVQCVSANVTDGDGLPTMGVMIRNGIVIACTQAIGLGNAISANLNVEICII